MRTLAPATGGILERILDATYTHWHEGLPRRAYGAWFAAQLATPWGRDHLSRWALLEGDEPIASAKLYEFLGSLDARPIRIAGLGAIFTPAAHRGRGAARELIDRLLEHAAARGVDVALLFSEIGTEYYARLGFEAISLPDLTLAVVEDTRRGAPATLVRAGDDRDLASLASIDAARAAPFRFRLDRDRDLVHYAIAKKRLLAGLSPIGIRELQFFVAEEGAEAVAYVAVSVNAGVWTIDSCGDRDPAGARLGAILQALVARDPAEPRRPIAAWLPRTLRPPQIRIVATAPSREVMMIRPLTDAGRAPRLAAEDVMFWKGDVF